MQNQISVITLGVEDLERSVRFYAEGWGDGIITVPDRPGQGLVPDIDFVREVDETV